jgi:hypothetical protein
LEAIARCSSLNVTLSFNDLKLFQERCFDRSVAIRKQSLISLSELFKQNLTSLKLCQMWISSVLPLIMDPEASIIEKCLDYFQQLVIDRIINPSMYLIRSIQYFISCCGCKYCECVVANTLSYELNQKIYLFFSIV